MKENITHSTDGTLLQKYIISISTYQTASYIDSMCAEITFFNNGASNMYINNGLTIQPGGTFSINGNAHELDVTKYQVSFADTTVQNTCVVIRKYYTA